MSRILIISFSNLDRDPRVNRQIELLTKYYCVTAVGFTNENLPNNNLIKVTQARNSLIKKVFSASFLKMRMYDRYYWYQDYVKEAMDKLHGKKFHMIIANDVSSLPLAFRIASENTRIIFDAHEYAPREFEDKFRWRFFVQRYNQTMCARYIPKVDAMMTVCDGIAEEYEKNFGVKPIVITNAPKYQDLQPSINAGSTIRIVHHGLAHRSRKIELMIEVFSMLDERFYMDFVLVGDSRYIKYLTELVAHNPRIRFLPPLKMKELPEKTNQYDIGLYLLQPTSFNNSMALPNKFFEFIQARLALAIGPSTEMAKIVKKYDCGVVATDFNPKSLAKVINGLTSEKIRYFKNQANLAAKQLCFERNGELILDLVQKTLAN